jgi:ArsR family transcriptional regulator, arsenate/arsenite/antimonite-responsive transcriptional repressor / arsenate reductase (thioredoxin)
VASSSQAAPAFVRLAGHPLRWQLLTGLACSDLRVRELVTLTGQPQNLISYHLRLLRDWGLVTAARSSFDGRDSYYHLNLDRCADALASTGIALHPALRLTPAPSTAHPAAPVAVLFVCTGNSSRSPIAEALLRRRAAGRVEAASAGTVPKPRLHPHTARLLRDEYGIDISGQRPRHLNTLTGRRFDYLITLCDKAREACPQLVDHTHRVHWSIPDPAAITDQAGYPAFARTAADIDTRIRYLLPVLATSNRKEAQP